MDYSKHYEEYLNQELTHCRSRYAFCQELDNLLRFEMTELERMEQRLATALQRLKEAHALFSHCKPVSIHTHSTSIEVEVQEEVNM